MPYESLIKVSAILLLIIIGTKFLLFLPVNLQPFALIGLVVTMCYLVPLPRRIQRACEDFHREYHGWDPEDFE